MKKLATLMDKIKDIFRYSVNHKMSCPKEKKVVYLPKKTPIYAFGHKVLLEGLIVLPSKATIEGENGIKMTDKFNQKMFNYETFTRLEARRARSLVCRECPILTCNYNLNLGKEQISHG